MLVLTDGSGHTDSSRLDQTTALAQQAGARPGPIYGRLTDRELYQAVLAGDINLFGALVREIADILAREAVDYVVGDAVEGVNPGHDVCRLLLNAALLLLESKGGRELKNLEFLLEGPPQECSFQDRADGIVLELSDEAYRRKLKAAHTYSEIAVDFTRLAANHDLDAFRIECLRLVRYQMDIGGCFAHPAVYETYGEKQVAAGFYREVIRFREHVAPLAKGLESLIARGSAGAP